MSSRRPAAALIGAAGLVAGCTTGSARDEALPEIPSETVELGYPSSVDRFTFRVSRSWVTSCHATLVHESWFLTAAHCFAGIEPGAAGLLSRSFRRLDARNVHLYPGALVDGSTKIRAKFPQDFIVPAHDLALVRVNSPITELEPAALWRPTPVPATPFQPGDDLWFGRERNGLEQTATASIVGVAPANLLLGPGHGGLLLVAKDAAVVQGDSGGGAFARAPTDSVPIQSPLSWSQRGQDALVAVMQNANPDNPRGPFGLVPVWTEEHLRWIIDTIGDAGVAGGADAASGVDAASGASDAGRDGAPGGVDAAGGGPASG